MSKRNFIRPVIAAALLLLFLVSASPRSWLHDIFAKHKDSYGFVTIDGKASVSAQHINCHLDSIVINEPYCLEDAATFASPSFFSTFNAFELKQETLSSRDVFIELRGPPAIA